jgi:hypothetical protein
MKTIKYYSNDMIKFKYLSLSPILPYVILILLLNCGLDDRYPPKGSFCDIMERPAPCMDVNFREKFIILNGETIPMNMITRVEYNFTYENKTYELGVLGEHRYHIKELGMENAKEKIFHRRKK